jgi:YggT family protein
MANGSYVGNAATFLISTLFGLYLLAILLRLLLQWVRADFYNPISQFLVRLSNPLLKPMRRYIPGYGGIDLASIILLLLLQMLELLLILWLRGGSPNPGGLLLWSIAELLGLTVHLYMVTIIVQVVLSWVNPGAYHPVNTMLYQLNEPLLGPARRMLPPMGGFDLSPLIVLVLLQLASMLLVAPLRDLGTGLTLG